MGDSPRSSRWFDEPLIRWVLGVAVFLALVHAASWLFLGAGQVIGVITWFMPAVVGFLTLASASVAFLSFGRFQVLRQPASFWIGMAFSNYTLLNVFFLASFPGLASGQTGLIAQLANTSAWITGFNASLLTFTVQVAVFAPWPRSAGRSGKRWLRLWGFGMATVSLIACLSLMFESYLPSMVIGGAFTPLFIGDFYALVVVNAVGVILASRRYRQTGDSLFVYLALTDVFFVFAFLDDSTGLVRHSLQWYMGSILMIPAVAIILFGLLSEYVGLYRRERQRTAELESLQQVTDPALAKERLEPLLHNLLERIVAIMGAYSGVVLLLDSERQELVIKAAVGLPEEQVDGYVIKVGEYFSGRVASLNSTYWVPDAQADPSTWSAEFEADGIKAMLGTPMRIGDEVIGVVHVDFREPREFGRQDERLLEVVAERAAIAVENSRLHRQEEQLAVVEERQRLARDLHDSVTQSLCSAILYAEAGIRLLAGGNQNAAMEHLVEVRDTTQETLREMRLLIFELRPPVLEKEGLVAALQTRLDAVETRAGLQTKLFAEGDERLASAIEEEVYRIAQEALNNVLKHARAKHVVVRLKTKDGGAILEVRDDGVGFDTSAVADKGGLGLSSMSERAERVGGKLCIESQRGSGTVVRFEVAGQDSDVVWPAGIAGSTS